MLHLLRLARAFIDLDIFECAAWIAALSSSRINPSISSSESEDEESSLRTIYINIHALCARVRLFLREGASEGERACTCICSCVCVRHISAHVKVYTDVCISLGKVLCQKFTNHQSTLHICTRFTCKSTVLQNELQNDTGVRSGERLRQRWGTSALNWTFTLLAGKHCLVRLWHWAEWRCRVLLYHGYLSVWMMWGITNLKTLKYTQGPTLRLWCMVCWLLKLSDMSIVFLSWWHKTRAKALQRPHGAATNAQALWDVDMAFASSQSIVSHSYLIKSTFFLGGLISVARSIIRVTPRWLGVC